MKKLIIFALGMLSSGAIYALPVGNPSEASLLTNGIFFCQTTCNTYDPCFCWCDAWSFRIGFYGDYVFNRNLKIRGQGINGQGETIQTTRLSTNAGFLALNICDKLDLFGTLGASRLSITTNDISWTALDNSEGRLDWNSRFSWSAGIRGTLFQCGRFSVGVEGQYFQTNPHLIKYLSFFDGLPNYFNEENKMGYKEWQVGTGLSYTLSTLCSDFKIVPYAAVKWAWVQFDTKRFQFVKTASTETFTIFNMKADKLWGYAIGVTATFFDRSDLTVEGRFADEKAVYVNGSVRF